MLPFITFSGLDGAGKSTLIAHTRKVLSQAGKRVVVLTMYDDISVFAYVRPLKNFLTSLLGRKKALSPDAQTGPRDTNFDQMNPSSRLVDRARGNVGLRKAVFFFDLFNAWFLLIWHAGLRGRVVIMDRFFYDNMADISLGIGGIRAGQEGYIRRFLSAAPKPALPVFIDVDPELAFARKQEYSPAYNRLRREVYLSIFKGVSGAAIVKNHVFDESLPHLEKLIRERILTTVSQS